MNHFTFACRSALVAASLLGFVAAAHAVQLPTGQRTEVTESNINVCVNRHVASGQSGAEWMNKVRTYCACVTENLLNEMTARELQQISRSGVAPASVQAKANQLSDMCGAQMHR